MRKHRISTLLVALAVLAVLSSCQKQGDEPTPQPEGETVAVKFNTFLREGDNVRPLNVSTRMTAGEGTLANGFYLYGHAHTLPFATTYGNDYTLIFENVKINTDGTYAIPKFWLQNKLLYYSFQAFAATDETGAEVGPGPVTFESGTPYVVGSAPDVELLQTDVLGAAVYDIKMGDEIPTVNLYFEHRLAKLSLQMQRMNAGGPTLHNVRMKIENLYVYSRVSILKWAPGTVVVEKNYGLMPVQISDPITLPASEMKPVEAHSLILSPRGLPADAQITLLYTLEPGPVSDSNPEMSLKTTLPALPLTSGKQLNVVIGHIVETEQIIIQSVSLTDWVTVDKDVPEYK